MCPAKPICVLDCFSPLCLVCKDFECNFDLLMGSVSEDRAASAETRSSHEDEDEEGQEMESVVAGADELEDEMPAQYHLFSGALFRDAQPMRLYQPKRRCQGADLRTENFGRDGVTADGVAWMFVNLRLEGTRVTDYGALEDGGVLPTLVGGPAASTCVDGQDEGRGGAINVKLGLYSGGRLEVKVECNSVTAVGLPGRMLVILDILLACFMGPPEVREAVEMEELEEEVAEEEEEEALGGGTGGYGYGTQVVARNAKWEVLEQVRNMYLYFGRLNAKFSVRMCGFSLLLPQDERDVGSNVLMAQVILPLSRQLYHTVGSYECFKRR